MTKAAVEAYEEYKEYRDTAALRDGRFSDYDRVKKEERDRKWKDFFGEPRSMGDFLDGIVREVYR